MSSTKREVAVPEKQQCISKDRTTSVVIQRNETPKSSTIHQPLAPKSVEPTVVTQPTRHLRSGNTSQAFTASNREPVPFSTSRKESDADYLQPDLQRAVMSTSEYDLELHRLRNSMRLQSISPPKKKTKKIQVHSTQDAGIAQKQTQLSHTSEVTRQVNVLQSPALPAQQSSASTLTTQIGNIVLRRLGESTNPDDKRHILDSLFTPEFKEIFRETTYAKQSKRKHSKDALKSFKEQALSFENTDFWTGIFLKERVPPAAVESFFKNVGEIKNLKLNKKQREKDSSMENSVSIAQRYVDRLQAVHRSNDATLEPSMRVLRSGSSPSTGHSLPPQLSTNLGTIMQPETSGTPEVVTPPAPAVGRMLRQRRVPVPSKKYPAEKYSLKDKTWCMCGVKGDDHLPAVQCDKCLRWWHYKNGEEGLDHCDYSGGPTSEEWQCTRCRDVDGGRNEKHGSENGDNDEEKTDRNKQNEDAGKGRNGNVDKEGVSSASSDKEGRRGTECTDNQGESKSETGNTPDSCKDEEGVSSINLLQETICSVLGVEAHELEYTPPRSLTFSIPVDDMEKIYNHETGLFTKTTKIRGDVLNDNLKRLGIPCAFKNRRDPYYYAINAPTALFARQAGYCTCGMKYHITFKHRPVRNEPAEVVVQSFGVFNLVQDHRTTRPISGERRKELVKALSAGGSMKVFVNDMCHVKGLDLLHRDVLHSTAILRTAKSEAKSKQRLHKDVPIDLQMLSKEMSESHNANSEIPGYIQYLNTAPDHFKIEMFDEQSIRLLTDTMASGTVLLGIDATGGVFKKLSASASLESRTVSSSHPHKTRSTSLLYTVVAQTKKGCFVVGDAVSRRGRSNDIAHFLQSIRRGIKRVKPYQSRCAPSIICCDFNFAMLHGISEGMNVMPLDVYLKKSFSVLEKNEPLPDSVACIQLCASHLTKSFLDNVRKKTKNDKKIVEMSVKGLGKMHEATNLDELTTAMADVCGLLGNTRLTDSEIKEYLRRIDSLDLAEWVGPTEDEASVLEEVEQREKLLREKSPFYHHFVSIRKASLKPVQADSDINPYYSSAVLEVFEKTYVPYAGLFCRGVVTISKDASFIRATNGCLESEFRIVKHDFIPDLINVADFVRERFVMHQARTKQFVLKSMPKKTRAKTENNGLESTLLREEREEEMAYCNEDWNKRTSKTKQPKYLHSRFLIQTRDAGRRVQLQVQKAMSAIAGVIMSKSQPDEAEKKADQADQLKEKASGASQSPEVMENKLDNAMRKDSSINHKPREPEMQQSSGEGSNPVFFETPSFGSVKKTDFHHFFHGDRYLSDDLVNGYLHKLMDNAVGPQKQIFVSHSGAIYHHEELNMNGQHTPEGWEESVGVLENLSASVHTHIVHPVHEGLHWYLAIVDIYNKKLTILDSMYYDGKDTDDMFFRIATFFQKVVESKGFQQVPGPWEATYPLCPRQKDSSSCGVYVGRFAKLVFESFPKFPTLVVDEDEESLRMEMAWDMMNTRSGLNHVLKYGEDDDAFIQHLKVEDQSTVAALERRLGQKTSNELRMKGKSSSVQLDEEMAKIYQSLDDMDTDEDEFCDESYKEQKRNMKVALDHIRTIQNTAVEDVVHAYKELRPDIILKLDVGNKEEFSRSFISRRQELYVKGSGSALVNMHVTYPFSNDQIDGILHLLRGDVAESANMFEGAFKLTYFIVPDTLERLYSHINKIPLAQAALEMRNDPTKQSKAGGHGQRSN